MSKRILVAVVVCVMALCLGQKTFGQATGSISGTVTDKSGAGVTGASVKVTSQATGATRETVTDETGHYRVDLLPISVYTIRVELKGFQPAESKDIKLQVDQHQELDFSLTLASVSSTVEVVANAVAVETSNPSLGQVITSQEVAQLPLNGRDFVQLATLTPGTTQETNPNSFFTSAASSEVAARGSFSLSVGGSRANSTDWLLDGVDNNELTAGGIAILSSIDSLQEFKVLTYNYSAEYGTRAGPTVLLTTKSGSNEFHGSVFEFFRNTALDAKSYFATSTEKFNLNQFGGTLGGPIQKGKTFFFIDGEQKDQLHGIPFQGLVPTAAMRNGDFSADNFGNAVPAGTFVVTNPNMSGASTTPNAVNSSPGVPNNNVYFQCAPGTNTPMPLVSSASGQQFQGQPCNVIPQALWNSVGQQMINLYPLPTPGYAVNGNNFQSEPVRSLYETKFDIRLDHNFSAADSLFARFSYDQATSYVPGGAAGFFAEANPFGSNQGIINHARNVAIGETHVFSPTRVNQLSFGYNRIFNYITSQGTGTCEATKLGIPGANVGCGGTGGTTCQGSSCGLTSTQLDGGYWSLGDRGYTPFQGGTNIYTINETFDIIHGKHDVRMGVGIRLNQMNVRAEGFQDGYWIVSGAWTGSAPADLLMGLASLRIHDQNFNGDITGRRWKLFRPFVQDDWRVTKDLTLNLGLAWNLTSPISEEAGRQANFIPSSTGYQWLIPTPGCTAELQQLGGCQPYIGPGAGVQMDFTAFEPRVGAAWKMFGSDKTVLRGGYAIYHDGAWSMGAQGLWQNPPYAAESFGAQFGGCTTATAYCAGLAKQTPNIGTGSMLGMSDGFPIITPPVTPQNFAGSFNTEPTNLKIGMVQQFNVNIERQLPAQIVLTAGYAGSRGSDILNFGNNINTGSPTACAGGPNAVPGYTIGCGPGGAYFASPYASQPFGFSNIYSINDLGRAHYNAFIIKAETKSPRYGLYFLIGYTYSRTYDTGYSDGLSTPIGAPYFPLPNWQKYDWALSQINLNNSFTASVIYDLPFGKGKKFGSNWNSLTNALLGGWQVTAIEKITSGFPIFIIDSNAASTAGANLINIGTASPAGRPDQVGSPFQVGSGANPGCNGNATPPTSLSAKGYWFNPCAFAAPATGELGSANRAPISGPDFVNTDFSVIKRFALPWENMGLDFRAEIFNLFNHAQFGLPANDINAPNQFGLISSTVNNPRLVQFGLKLTF
jgi:Carboxypeptidase regulatory-like domain